MLVGLFIALLSVRSPAAFSSPDERVMPHLFVTPGPPPLLSFRLYEGRLHHRDPQKGLMLDDAGH